MHINNAFILRNIYGKNILMPICKNSASSDPILFNDVAVSIWQAATSETTKEDILKTVMNSYGLLSKSPESIAIENFINQLIDMNLLVESTEV